MHTTKIQMAPSGPELSRIIQGYMRLNEWQLNTQELISFTKAHIELGITTVDHANVYGNLPCEELFGQALKAEPTLRNEIQIITKFGINRAVDNNAKHYDSSNESIINSVNLSLQRLQTEQIDVLLFHRPDYLMNAEQVAETFTQLHTQGKIKYFGVSNFNSDQFELLQSVFDMPLVTNQIEINPINHKIFDSGILETMQKHRVSPMAWSCLGGGEIFGSNSTQSERSRTALQEMALELDVDSIDKIIYAWIMHLPSHPVPVLGTGNLSRIKNAVEALQVKLTSEQWYRLLKAFKGADVA